jgi:hypothetical protein
VDRKLKPFNPVINQMVVNNSMLCKKVIIMTVALPGTVLTWDQIIVEYAPSLNGGGLLLWIPCGQVNRNTDKLKVVLLKLGSKGITEADAIILVQALESSW